MDFGSVTLFDFNTYLLGNVGSNGAEGEPMTGGDVYDEVRSLNEASNSARKYKFEEVEASSDGERVSGLSDIFAWAAD